MSDINHSEVELVKTQHWRYEDTDYVLGYIPEKCNRCGKDIPEDEAGYLRKGPRANGGDGGIDEICWDCGDRITQHSSF